MLFDVGKVIPDVEAIQKLFPLILIDFRTDLLRASLSDREEQGRLTLTKNSQLKLDKSNST